MKKIIFGLIVLLLASTCVAAAFAHDTDSNIDVLCKNHDADNNGLVLINEKQSPDAVSCEDWDFEWENIKGGGAK